MFAGIKVGKVKMKRKTYTRWLKYFTACIFPDYVQKNQFMKNAINSRKETIKMLDRRQILWSQKFISKLKILSKQIYFSIDPKSIN